MPPRFEFEFGYASAPQIVVMVRSPLSGRSIPIFGLIDTGADITVLDYAVADALGIELADAGDATITGLGGVIPVKLATVELILLNEPQLALTTGVGYANVGGRRLGNLIGLDVLEHFDFGLSHRRRLGYLGRALT